jgi:homopolymeric O-antigen transport system permease protein
VKDNDPTAGVGVTTRVYTPDSPLRRPKEFVSDVARDVRSLRVLTWRLVVRDLAATYRQTAFGYLWAVLPAVFLAVVWIGLNSSKVINVETGDVPYAAFVITGTTFWQLFLDALNSPLKQMTQNRSMLNRVNFPAEALIASGIAQVLFSFLVKLVVLAIALAVVGAPVKATAPLIVLPALGLLILGTVIGILIAPIGMLYKDIEQGLLMIVLPLLFLTPVVYPVQSGGAIGRIMHLNPLTPMFEVTREFLFGGSSGYVTEFFAVCGVSVVLALVGWVVYRVSLPILIERLEA